MYRIAIHHQVLEVLSVKMYLKILINSLFLAFIHTILINKNTHKDILFFEFDNSFHESSYKS